MTVQGAYREGAYRVVTIQALALTGVTAGLALAGSELGTAALLGGLTILMPNAWFAWASTRRKPGGWLLVQGVVKFVSTIIFMALVLKNLAPGPAGFFSGVIVTLLAHAVGSYWQPRSN